MSSKVIFIVRYGRGYPVPFGPGLKDVVAAVFPWFGRSGSPSRAEQRFIAESP